MNKTSDIEPQTLLQPRLSIIVPIYNVAPYLRKCVDSLLAQDFSDYEIILVDDGSTDGSGEIADEYQSILNPSLKGETYQPSIKVIHQENKGLSEARNTGVKAAQGDYVCFVDSDDYWEPNVLGALMGQIERDKLDVLRYNYQNVNEQYEMFLPFKDAKRDIDYSEVVTTGETFLTERLGPSCYAVMFIVKREIALQELFTPNIYFEDTDWTPRMLLCAKRVASTPMIVYNYLWRQGSITLPDNPIKKKKLLEDKFSLLRGFQEQQKNVHNKQWFVWMTSFTAMTILNSIVDLPMFECRYYVQQLRLLRIFPLLTTKEKGTHKRKIQIANISPLLYCMLMKIINHLL